MARICDIAIDVHSAASGGGTGTLIATASVRDSSMVVLDKNTALYLEEDRSITATAVARILK